MLTGQAKTDYQREDGWNVDCGLYNRPCTGILCSANNETVCRHELRPRYIANWTTGGTGDTVIGNGTKL